MALTILNYGETFLDAVAGLSGKTSYEVWASGNNWKDIVKHAESVLGKQSKWKVFESESGQGMIIGANGRIINFGSAAGEAQSYVAANQLVTDAVVEESGALTSYYGNIVDAGGKVTKKGLALGASTGAKVVGGALAVFGAVATGVDWYRDNPEFWTNVSQKLLPFAYKDPTDKSWGDIFYDALVPTAVDDEGNTYIQESLLQGLKEYMVENDYFTTSRTASVKADEVSNQYLKNLADIEFPVITPTAYYYSPNKLKPDNSSYYTFKTTDVMTVIATSTYGSGHTGVLVVAASKTIRDNLLKYGSIIGSKPGEPSVYTERNGAEINLENETLFVTSSNIGRGSSECTYIPTFVDITDRYPYGSYNSDLFNAIAYILLYGHQTAKTPLDNVDYPVGNTLPDGRPLSEIYPEWYKNAQTTVNPNWNPSEPESESNPKYVVWLPVQIPSDDTPDGDTEPDTTQEDAQKGKPTPKPSVDPTTDSAITDGVIPDPYPDPEDTPSLNPDPQPDPSPDPTPDPTDPSDPTSVPTPTPTPGVPSIGGGSANALWKIYNPSQATLQQFGAWLWSDNPLELIKQIFSNSPAEGVVGLHMIYVKPPIGGTANIKVGYLDSGVASPWVSQQYVSFDCGSVTVPLAYQSALDFGYTKVYCYLPFIGIVPLDSFDIIGKTVSIKYTVDVLTGAVLAQISVSSGSYNAVLYTFNGSCSVEYPLTAGTRASQLLSLVTGAVGGAVVGGVGGAIIGGVRGAATGADVRMSGNLSGNAGAMGIRKPYLIVKRPVEVAARSYNIFYGYPANITGLLSSFSGYTRVKSAHVENITRASDAERDMIMTALRDGVIV